MIHPAQLRRLLVLAILLGGIFAALGYRLVVLQILQHDKYRLIAGRNTQRVFLREPRRGDILDVHGNPLATSLPVKRVCADPRYVGSHAVEIARTIAPLLQLPEADLARRLQPIVHTNQAGLLVTNSQVNLKRKVSVEQWQQITQAMGALAFAVEEKQMSKSEKNSCRLLRQHAIFAVDDQQRVYPSRNLAAHVVGFARSEETEFNNTVVNEITGVDGIEAWCNTKLSGVRGWRVTETDRRKREIVAGREQEVEARPGLNAVLTLDLLIQDIVEKELAEAMKKHSPTSVSALVVRPRTGEILAMATLPNYDPNQPGVAPEDHRRNRVITDRIEPGST